MLVDGVWISILIIYFGYYSFDIKDVMKCEDIIEMIFYILDFLFFGIYCKRLKDRGSSLE